MYLKLTEQEIKDFISKHGDRKLIVSNDEFNEVVGIIGGGGSINAFNSYSLDNILYHDHTSNVYDIDEISDELDSILTSFFEDDITFQMIDERIQSGSYPLLCKGVQTQKYYITTPQGGLITTEFSAWTGTHDTILEITKTVFNNWCAKHRK